MAKALTPISIQNMKPAPHRREIPDGGCRGLYLIVQPTGRHAWAVRYRFGEKSRKLTLDSTLTLAEARKVASEAMHELAQGRDPVALKFDAATKAAQAEAERNRDTVERWIEQFLQRYARKNTRPSSWQQAEHALNDLVVPAWRCRSIHDIERRDIKELVGTIAETRGPVMGNRTHAHLSKFFNWLVDEDVLKASPCVGIRRPSKETPRDRVLTDDEIKALWLACDAIGYPAGPAIKLLLLTGQRFGEVCGMKRSEISGDTWTLPGARVKNKKEHDVPLSAQALAIIEAVPAIDEEFVFATSETRQLGNVSHAKAAIDEKMQPKDPWVLHDLRRTLATGLQKLGVRLEVTEAVLNHRSGSFRGIVGVYQRHEYAAEKRHALQRWADHVEALVSGREKANVITLRG